MTRLGRAGLAVGRHRRRPTASPASLSAALVGLGVHGQPGSPAHGTEVAGERQTAMDRGRRALIAAVIGLAAGLATTSRSATAAPPVAASAPAGRSGPGDGASNARSGPAAGGAAGTVGSVSASSFTLTTSAGQKVTVDETSSTTYQNGTNATSANAITTGQDVVALGTTNGTTITATQVIVTPAGGGGSAPSSAATVIPFQRGAPTTSKQVGQIPANFSQGSGTIVSGTTANKATAAALAAYPGGVVDRVVQLSNGEHNVHYIGVNWAAPRVRQPELPGGWRPLTHRMGVMRTGLLSLQLIGFGGGGYRRKAGELGVDALQIVAELFGGF